MRCDEVDKLIPDYSVDNLSGGVQAKVREHIDSCPGCARELERLEYVMASVGDMAEAEPPAGLWNGVYNRITAPVAQTTPGFFSRVFARPLRAFSVSVAVAALAGLVFFGAVQHRSQTVAQGPAPAEMEYIQSHVGASSQDVFADRVSLEFVASIPTSGSGHAQ